MKVCLLCVSASGRALAWVICGYNSSTSILRLNEQTMSRLPIMRVAQLDRLFGNWFWHATDVRLLFIRSVE